MKTYFTFMYNDRKCEVEMYDKHNTSCVATFQVDCETFLQHEFKLTDLDLSCKGSYFTWDYATESPKEEQFIFNPYLDGFEYCESEVIEYLYNANFELITL